MRILLAEDEAELSRAVVAILKHSGYDVDAAMDGVEAVEYASSNSYDCMVFDIMMPRKDGVEALKEIRATGNVTPIILLTAKAELDDKVVGLEAGADDYLTKPFAMKELLVRIKALTRRMESYTPTRLTVGTLTLDVKELEMVSGNSIRLSSREAKLMEYLMLNSGKELPTEDIFAKVWADDENASVEIVWVYISYLRGKLDSVKANLYIKGEKNGKFALLPVEL